jgi:hypothetical protein
MKTKILTISLIAVLAMLLSGPATAQGPQPPVPPYPPHELGKPLGPFRTPDGYWFKPEGARLPLEATGISPQATGGPDDYGYTWSDELTFSWIDAKSLGINANLYGGDVYTGPVNIDFAFPFYENNYSQLYFSTKGLISFGQGTYSWNNTSLPNLSPPNNIVAVFWDDLGMYRGNRSDAGIYIYQGGEAPNRYLVIEWYRADVYSGEGSSGSQQADLTFEVILHENGDIVMQYLSLSGNLQSATVGIEDDIGVTGLQYLYNAPGLGNNKAIRFYRPGPMARVKVWPLYQGRFTRAGATESFQVPIRNTGELGADTYDLSVSSSWPVSLYAADGITPLTDTDGDGAADTGSVAQGGTVTITVKVATPAGATVGDENSAAITVRSSLNTSKSKTVTLQTAVPAPFAQVYRDDADGAMSLYLAQPGGQAVKKATPDWYYGYNTAVAEAPNGNFIYAWYKGRCLDSNCNVYVSEIEYALLDRYGNVVRPVSKLTDNSGATMNTYDYSPAVAVAPNGRIGVLWYRYLWNRSTSQSNYNIWFAILDASGNRVYGPVNLTNNNAWGTWSDLNVPWLYSPRIAATGDNRFVLAWGRSYYGPPTGSCTSYCSVDDLFYTVRDTGGGEIRPVTKFTNDTPGWDQGYYGPTLAQLTGNRVVMAWNQTVNNQGAIAYAVLDSGGTVIKSPATINMGGWGVDAVQFSTGRVLLAWSVWTTTNPQIAFAVLDTSYNVVAGPTTLSNPAAPFGDAYVSVAADSTGHAILTWMDYDWSYRRNLYYALVDGNGNVLTPPMIFRTSQATSPYIFTSYEGYGNTSYSWTPPSGVDGVAAFSASLFGGPPGGNAAVGVRYANRGATIATGVVLTATLDSNLTYVSDTSGIVPTVSGNDVVWNLPDLGFLESGDFTLYVQVPSGADYGTRYPITLTLTSAGSEANPSDNTASAQVMAARQVFLPLVLRNYR